MNCYYHSDQQAEYTCLECGKTICESCVRKDGDKAICKVCEEAIQGNINYGYNKFFGFILSFIPGASHMYLGFMDRGLTLLLGFIGLIFFMNVTNSNLMPFPLIVLFFYGFFDAYHLKRKIDNRETIIYRRFNIDRIYYAYGFIAIGTIVLINVILDDYIFNFMTYAAIQRMRSIIFPLLLIVAGVVMIMRIKKKEDKVVIEHDIEEN